MPTIVDAAKTKFNSSLSLFCSFSPLVSVMPKGSFLLREKLSRKKYEERENKH